MPGSAATRSAGRLRPRNWAPAVKPAFLVLLFVVTFLGASAVIYGTPWAASATKPQCNNRTDDDGDGKIDYPADPGCKGRGDKSEVDLVEPPPPPPPPSPPPPPPPPAGCPYAQSYFCVDYSSQDYRVPWTTLFSYTAPGFVGLDPATGGSPPAGTPDGRVQVVPDPAGGPGFASRHEMRDSDPKWADLTPDVQKAEVRTTTPYTFNKPGVAIGDIRWFSFRIYLPYTATEKFEWASGGSNNFNTYMDIHPGASVPGALGIEWYGGGNPKYWTLRHDNGTTATSYNLFQLTDSSGARIMANHNRWIEWHLGVRFATDSSGWFEAWVDGVNVLPRTFGKTMSAGDTQQYLKQGLYKQRDAHYPSGVSVVYYGRTAISVARPF
jgi:hypothetical protein